MNVYEQHFDSIPDMIYACDKAWKEGRCYSLRYLQDSYFVGRSFNSLEDVKKAVIEPWEEGLSIVQGMIYEIDREAYTLPQPKNRRRLLRWNEYDGDEVDNDRLRDGQAFWKKGIKQIVTAPQFVTIVTGTATSSHINSDNILWRGATGVCLADILEKAGYRIKLMIAEYTKGSFPNVPHQKLLTTAVVKEEQDVVDIASVVNVLSGWFHRTMVFQSHHIRKKTKISTGYGQPLNLREDDDPLIQNLAGNGSLLITIDGVWSKEQALAKVRSVIQQVNNTETVA